MELASSANLVLIGYGLSSYQKLMEAVRKSKPNQTNGDSATIAVLQRFSVID
jgi:hypothetical protein